jgi:hypothetical protein
MSQPAPRAPEPEQVETKVVVLVAAAALALFTAATVVTWLVLQGWRREPAAPVPPEVGRLELGMVNQAPFALDTRAERLRREERERLSSYGWVDPEQRLIHLPVERAMERLLSEEGAEGGR